MTTQRKQPADRLRSQKKPVQKSLYFAGDSEEAEAVEALIEEKDRFQTLVGRMPSNESAKTRLAELEVEVSEGRKRLKDHAVKFTFTAIRRDDFDKLVGEHIPTEEQKAEAKANGIDLPYNSDTFPKALIIACCTEPDMEKEELAEWLDENAWNNAELIEMFQAALHVNQSRRLVLQGKD